MSNSIKYKKINNKKIINNKNLKITGKNNIPTAMKHEIPKEEKKGNETTKENDLGKIYIDLKSNSQKTKNSSSPQEKKNQKINLNNKTNVSLKSNILKKNKYLKNSPNKMEDIGRSMIYQKPKLLENSIKRDKKNIFMNNKPMTSKRQPKKINYMKRNITPKKEINLIGNKSENISSIDDKHIYSKRNKNIYKNGYASVNREKIHIPRPLETSPERNYTSINNNNPNVYLNLIKKKEYKKLQNDIIQRPQSATPSKKNTKLNNENNLLDKNNTEINLNIETNINNDLEMHNKKKRNENKEFISNRENMVNMLINNYNKKNINFNSYNNSNNKANNQNYFERPNTTNNNPNNYINRQIIIKPQLGMNNPKKVMPAPYNKIKSREKQNFNKKRIMNKNSIERDMTEPELLKMFNPNKIIDSKKGYPKNLNISLNNKEQNTFLHQPKGNKMIRFKTNNNPRYNQYYSNNVNQTNPQIFNNYVSINNLVTPNFPVKLLNVFVK